MQQYRDVDAIFSDRRKGQKLAIAFEKLLNSPHILELFENPFDLFESLYPGDYLDASTQTWENLPVELQTKYAKAYQEWYAIGYGYSSTTSTFQISHPSRITTVFIPPMRYKMGSPKSEEGHAPNENQKIVTVHKPFWMGQFKVSNLEYYNRGHVVAEPVTHVSYWDAMTFCRNNGLYLPSEAEWELACRAGTTTPYHFGYYEAQLENYAWYIGNSIGQPQALGRKLPNAWGLHDMYGNVYEWTRDRRKTPSREAIFRGSYYNSNRLQCRSACRDSVAPEYFGSDTGFRVVWHMVPT